MNIVTFQSDPDYQRGNIVHISLSRRNLLALLSKVDDPASESMLIRSTDLGLLTVVAENDDQHYGPRPHGRMSPDTEAFIEAHQ